MQNLQPGRFQCDTKIPLEAWMHFFVFRSVFSII